MTYKNKKNYTYHLSVHLTTAYHNLHTSTCLIQTHSVSLRDLVCCGECKQGFSNVFGSSRCKHCSNFYVFTIVPIAIAGLVLVIMLFTFNLTSTVTNGIINTLKGCMCAEHNYN